MAKIGITNDLPSFSIPMGSKGKISIYICITYSDDSYKIYISDPMGSHERFQIVYIPIDAVNADLTQTDMDLPSGTSIVPDPLRSRTSTAINHRLNDEQLHIAKIYNS